MSTLSTNKNRDPNTPVLGSLSNGFYAAIIYGVLFVPLMLVTHKEITADVLGIPALVIFLGINFAGFLARDTKTKAIPQWIVLSAFVVPTLTAIVMTLIID